MLIKYLSLFFICMLFITAGCLKESVTVSSCPAEVILGPELIPSTATHFNIFSDRDTLVFERSAGEVLFFTRVRPEMREVVSRNNYRSVSCVDNPAQEVFLSSHLEQINNLFTTSDNDTLQIGLNLVSFNTLDPFDPVEFVENTPDRFLIYLEITITSSRTNERNNSRYVAYRGNEEYESPAIWTSDSPMSVVTASNMTVDSTFSLQASNGRILYNRNVGIVGFSMTGEPRWLIR